MRMLIGMDGSEASAHLVEQCVRAARATSQSEVHLVSVLPLPVLQVTAPAPVATAAAVTAMLAAQEQQQRADEAKAKQVLKAAAQICVDAGVPEDQIHTHVLPPTGGASGVGDSIVSLARSHAVDMVVVGSRGLGSLQRSLMSLAGLGSVSDFCSHNLHVPVMVVRPTAAQGHKAEHQERSHVVVVAVDDSVHSAHALSWVLDHLADERSELHCVCVALPVPYPIPDDTSAAVVVLEAQEWQDSSTRHMAYAKELASRAAAAAIASGRVVRERVVWEALPPEGGASDCGASIVRYARQHNADLVVVGSRGMGSFRRSIMSFVGLGSVSDYCIHHLSCPVLVVKAEEGALPKEADHAAGAAAAAVAASPQPPGVDGDKDQ